MGSGVCVGGRGGGKWCVWGRERRWEVVCVWEEEEVGSGVCVGRGEEDRGRYICGGVVCA